MEALAERRDKTNASEMECTSLRLGAQGFMYLVIDVIARQENGESEHNAVRDR